MSASVKAKSGKTPTNGRRKWMFAALVATLAAAIAVAASFRSSEQSFDIRPGPIDPQFKRLDKSGRIRYCESFLSDDEVDHLLHAVNGTGRGWVPSKSGGAHFEVPDMESGAWRHRVRSDEIVSRVEARIAQATRVDVHPHEDAIALARISSHGSAIRGGHYPPFGLHHDTDTRPWRVRTVIIYLTDVEGSGRTIFPLAKPAQTTSAHRRRRKSLKSGAKGFREALQAHMRGQDAYWSRQVTFPLESDHVFLDVIEASCRGEWGVGVEPRRGAALMFEHLRGGDPARPDVRAWHAGCNVIGDSKKVILQKFKELPLGERRDRSVQADPSDAKVFGYVGASTVR